MQMLYRILADGILVLHALIVLFIVGALPLIWLGYWRHWRFVRKFWFRATHLALIGFVTAESVFGALCPLTTWESDLRLEAGIEPYGGTGFIAHWVQRFLFYDWDEKVFTATYIAFFALVLLTFILVKPSLPERLARRRSGEG